jgi:hypothetical protein
LDSIRKAVTSLSDFIELTADRMASPARLTETISEATGLPLATVVDIDRRLAKAGLRTIGGRGFSAARMTPLDAARLLTAVLASAQSNTSAEAVERYMQTRLDKARSNDGLYVPTELGDLAILPARHSFVDAVAALISSALTGSLAKLIAASKDGWVPRIELYAFTRATRGRIRISGLPNGLTASVQYHLTSARQKAGRAKTTGRVHRADASTGDLEQSRRITERTILPIAELLAQEG